MTGQHPLSVRQWLRRIERDVERAPKRKASGSVVLVVSSLVGLALAALLAAVTR